MFIKRTSVYVEQGKQLILKVIKMFIKRRFVYMEQGKQLILKVIEILLREHLFIWNRESN